MAGESSNNLHIALFPWLAFGHILPFLQLAVSLAQRGHRISFVSTPRNLQRLPTALSSLIHLIPISLPLTANLPPNAEATSDIAPDQIHHLWDAFDSLQDPAASFLESSRPDWIISDFAPYWLVPIASKLHIPYVFFNICNASTFAFFGPQLEIMDEDGATTGSRSNPQDFTVPPKWIPFPSNLAFRPYEVRNLQKVSIETSFSPVRRLAIIIQGCKLMIIRTCTEFEQEWVHLLQCKLFSTPVLPIGLLPPRRPDTPREDENREITKWLNKQREKSVVYVAFGSEAELSQEQLTELAHGLELSNLPFLWAIKKRPGVETGLPIGFAERVKDRSYITMDWVPQLSILAHSSVGGFLTHSGWSSVVEGLAFGLGLILLPLTSVQGLHSRLLEWKKIGMEIQRDENDGSFVRESVSETIRVVMIEEQGELLRENVKEVSKIIANFELQDRYVGELDQQLREEKYARHISSQSL